MSARRKRRKKRERTIVVPCEVCGRAGRLRRIGSDRFVLCDECDPVMRRSLTPVRRAL